MFSIITDFFSAFPSLIFFDWIVFCLFVCLDERYQISPRLESTHQHSLIESFNQLFFLFFTGIMAEMLSLLFLLLVMLLVMLLLLMLLLVLMLLLLFNPT